MSNKNSKTSKIIFTILLIVGVILVLIGFLGFVYCAYKMVTDSIFNLGVSPVSFFIPFVIGSVLAAIGQKELRRIYFESKTNEQMQTSTFDQNVQNLPETENQNNHPRRTRMASCCTRRTQSSNQGFRAGSLRVRRTGSCRKVRARHRPQGWTSCL